MERINLIGILLLAGLLLSGCGKKTADDSAGTLDKNQTTHEQEISDMGDTLAILETSYGRVVIDLFEETAPRHAENFKKLMRSGALKGTYFHRIIPNFVVQGGDPNTLNDSREDDGMGGIGERIPAEIGQPHLRGSLGAARDNNPAKASSGSQFYFCLAPLPQLDGNYTVFGTVVEGMNNVDLMAQVPTDKRDNPIESIFITNTTLMDKVEYNQMKSDAS